MKDIEFYTPEVCDGDYCPMDCSHCYKKDEVLEYLNRYAMEEYDEDTESD